jgi:uncharacterized protein YbjT (DUF2867 family)
MSEILVLGAGGKTGRHVVTRLKELGVPYRAASRDGTTRFDWNDSDTWDSALEGANGVYIVRPELQPNDVLEAFVHRAVVSGAQRLVLLSARAGGEQLDRPRERIVCRSGAAWTILRPTWYFQNFSEGLFRTAIRTGQLRLPAGTGREAFVDAEDIADVAVAALTRDGHQEQTYALSGPRALSFQEVATLIGEMSGRPIHYQGIAPADYVSLLVAEGEPVRFAELQAKLLEWIAESEGDYVSDGVQRALGRPPRAFEDYVKQTAWI